jgi:hypothetical protein
MWCGGRTLRLRSAARSLTESRSRVGFDERAAIALKRLASILDDELQAVERITATIQKILVMSKTDENEWLRIRALAFELERLYTACESLLVRVLKDIDGSEPVGAHHHRETLTASAVAIDGVRPAVIAPRTKDLLDELRRFRHFARHDYGTAPNFERVDEVARRALEASQAFAIDVRAFIGALRDEAKA